MATTLADVVSLINDRRRDTTTNSIDMTAEGFRAINSVLKIWQQTHDWVFTIEKTTINFNKDITTYTLPSNHKRSIDIKHEKPANDQSQEWAMVSQGNFDSERLKTKRFAIETIAQTERLRLEATGNVITLQNATTFDGNGTWVASSDASNVTTDTNEFYDLTSSVNFDVSGTSAVITITDMQVIDVRSFVDRSGGYFNMYLPTVTDLTDVEFRFGSSASDYYSTTVTTDYLGDTLVTGWNKIKGNWDSITGTLDNENINYIQIIITYGSSTTDTDFRIENFFMSENIPLTYEYYSTDMTLDAGDGTTKRAEFDNSASTTDTFLWSGKYDYITETFVQSVMEFIFFMTGENTDYAITQNKIFELVGSLKRQLPTRRRRSEMQFTLE